MTICCVKGCGKEQFPGCGLHFHLIPENPELREQWLKAIPLEGKLLKNSTVCSSHFKSEDYVPTTLSDQRVRTLKQGVIPSIFAKVDESNKPDSEEESRDDEIDTDNITAKTQNNTNNCMGAINVSALNKTNKVMVLTPGSGGNKANKIMVVTPISTINKIEDAITIKPDEYIQPSSRVIKTVGTSATSQVGSLLYKSLTQTQSNKIIVVKPIAENERIEEIISTKSVSNSDDSDISSENESPDSNMSSDDEKSMVMPGRAEVYIKEATPERDFKRKYVQETPIDMYASKVPRYSNLDVTEKNVTQNTNEKPIKYHVSTQTGPYTTHIEQELKKKIKVLRQKINRRVTAFNQMKTVLNLIKNKCKNYAEVKEVLTLKLKQLPENLNCDGVIIAP